MRSGTVSTWAPVARSRSSTTSACASPRHHSTSWPVSACRSTRTVGSPAVSRPSALASASSSPRVAASTAIGSSGSGISHGAISSGADFAEIVSPVSAVPSRPTAQMSPATARSIGRSVAPSGEKICADPLVGVVVGMPALAAAVARRCGSRLRRQRAGEHAQDRQPAEVRVDGRAHHLGQQRAVGVAVQRLAPVAVRPIDRRAGRSSAGDGNAAGEHLEQLGEPEPGRRAHRQHREERAASDGGLEVVDEDVEADLLAGRGSARAASRPRCC